MSKKMMLTGLLALIAIVAASCNQEECTPAVTPTASSDTAMVISSDSAMVVPTDRSSNMLRIATADLRAGDTVMVVIHRRP